jgi:hypothetical protein
MPMLRIGSALSIGLVVSGMPFEPESTSQRAASWNVSIALRLGLWHDGCVRATRMWACNAEVTVGRIRYCSCDDSVRRFFNGVLERWSPVRWQRLTAPDVVDLCMGGLHPVQSFRWITVFSSF